MIRTVAVIPFYNEQKFIPGIFNKVLPYVDNIIAIDDGSVDNSAGLIPVDSRIILISLERNFGKGYALNAGFNECILRKFDVVVTLDADFQHPPELIPLFLEKLKDFDAVIGVRKKDPLVMPFMRILSNSITSFLLGFKAGFKIPDSQCGFRAYKVSILSGILPKSTGFEAESEILVYFGRKKFLAGFVEIPTIYGEEESKMRNLQAIKGFLKVLLLR